MSLLDDIMVNAACAVNSAAKSAGKVIDKSKLRLSITEVKKKISGKFETLGRYVYDTHVSENTDPEIINQYYAEISELISQLKTLQDTLGDISDKTICPKCGCSNSSDSLYCKLCGTSLDFSNTYTPKNGNNDCVGEE